jgi:hypothetical protein
MIQELRSLLLNTKDASGKLLMPSSFSTVKLSKIETGIRNAILGGDTYSTDYKCFVADRLFNAIYSDSEFADILNECFDKRVYTKKTLDTNTIRPRYNIDKGAGSLVVDVSRLKPNRTKESIHYTFIKRTGTTLFANGGIGDNQQVITFSTDDLINGSSWKLIADSGVYVKFHLNPMHIAGADGPNPYITSPEIGSITVNVPFTVDLSSVLTSVLSIDGLIDFMSLIGEEHPELLHHFYSNNRNDRRLFSVVVAYGISTKRKLI